MRPGPSGAPSRGRADVLPTGRNLFALDPRAVPTRSAVALAERAAAELLRRHRQDHGDWPRSLVIDLWGSTSLRTGGEDLALALLLMGARPIWDEGSGRVTGVEIVPLAVLDRPRIDVTLRISGPVPRRLSGADRAVRPRRAGDRRTATRRRTGTRSPPPRSGLQDEARRRATARIFGAAPGRYGAGIEDTLARGAWTERAALGARYLAVVLRRLWPRTGRRPRIRRVSRRGSLRPRPSSTRRTTPRRTCSTARTTPSTRAASRRRRRNWACTPALYHADTADPDAPRIRPLADEIARVVRGRAINPDWIAGQRRHGHRGAAELARTLDSLHAFAATLPTRLDRQFDLYFDATLGNADTDGFLRETNPAAHAAMRARFAEAMSRGLWRPRRNSVAAMLESAA